MPKRNQKDITSLIEEFQYPKFGPGMMWERCTEIVEEDGGRVLLEARVSRIDHADGVATAVAVDRSTGDATATEVLPATAVISSMPLPASAAGDGPARRRPTC